MPEADRSRDQHPLDPDPPRPPGVPDLDLDIPISRANAPAETPVGERPDVDKEVTEAPD